MPAPCHRVTTSCLHLRSPPPVARGDGPPPRRGALPASSRLSAGQPSVLQPSGDTPHALGLGPLLRCPGLPPRGGPQAAPLFTPRSSSSPASPRSSRGSRAWACSAGSRLGSAVGAALPRFCLSTVPSSELLTLGCHPTGSLFSRARAAQALGLLLSCSRWVYVHKHPVPGLKK